ncbi:hypothetical protein AVEN_271795-1 [Araneus ventricosus]|uniref:Uncharacterized protein n=1 Tax=Araneus ventricosus TaxID=182803 RepID=A0A4Y2W2Y3_ARAVE|nr:hypothetical protein AVEN_271795-1 [Araneus ventricosus]
MIRRVCGQDVVGQTPPTVVEVLGARSGSDGCTSHYHEGSNGEDAFPVLGCIVPSFEMDYYKMFTAHYEWARAVLLLVVGLQKGVQSTAQPEDTGPPNWPDEPTIIETANSHRFIRERSIVLQQSVACILVDGIIT